MRASQELDRRNAKTNPHREDEKLKKREVSNWAVVTTHKYRLNEMVLLIKLRGTALQPA
jgi:hypothetical protein